MFLLNTRNAEQDKEYFLQRNRIHFNLEANERTSEFALIRNGQLHPSCGFLPGVPELFTLNSGPLTLLEQVLACP